MQPYLFPYIGYFQLVNAVDRFVMLDDVNYINKGWVNRNRILVGGKEYLFTIPLIDASQNRYIKDIEVSNDPKWRAKFLKSVEMSYSKAPYFKEAFGIISKVINSSETFISKIVLQSLKEILNYLEIEKQIVESSSVYNNRELKGQDRILDISLKEGATQYINPIGGTELYSKDIFTNKNVQLNFIKSKPINYAQFKNEFVPWLSVIDVLMFNSKEQVREFLNLYDLV